MSDSMTKRRFVGFQDSRLEEYPWGNIRWSVNAELNGSEHLTEGRVEINSLSNNPKHYHPNCDEVVLVESDRIRHLVGDEWYTMKRGDAVHVPQGTLHQARNLLEEPAILVISYNSGRRKTVGEGLQ